MGDMPVVSRRRFLVTTAALGGGMAPRLFLQ